MFVLIPSLPIPISTPIPMLFFSAAATPVFIVGQVVANVGSAIAAAVNCTSFAPLIGSTDKPWFTPAVPRTTPVLIGLTTILSPIDSLLSRISAAAADVASAVCGFRGFPSRRVPFGGIDSYLSSFKTECIDIVLPVLSRRARLHCRVTGHCPGEGGLVWSLPEESRLETSAAS